MNGKVSKRIRIAAAIISNPDNRDATIKRLKREYLATPYHQRKTPKVESHSVVLRKHHMV